MLCVKTIIKQSDIHGLGLFADQKISAGTVIWKYTAGFDHIFDPSQIDNLPSEAKIFLAKYAYKSKRTGTYILDTDDARYFNHSDTPNSGTVRDPSEEEDVIVALHDIDAGNEITINYENQEVSNNNDNVLWKLYQSLGLDDEVDPRIKNSD